MQSTRKEPARILPAAKLIQARYARMTTMEPLQTNSNVFMQVIYNETIRPKMGIIP